MSAPNGGHMFRDKSILITGGTGSFGQRLVATLLEKHKPSRLIVYSRDELKQFEMAQRYQESCMRYFLGDVRDAPRLRRAFDGVDIVVHSAALKQVPALEYNPFEAVKTNVLGTENVVNTAIECGVKHVIALSTDKAANPINLYGATKLVADKLVIAGNNIRGKRETKLAVVRYGNVLGSRGSVVPFFRELIRKGEKELPVTDRRMTRFSITLQQGVDFVLACLERMHGGELFVPKIPSLRVIDVVEAMSPGARVREVGIRPGEKLHEVLCPAELSRSLIEFKDYFLIPPDFKFTGLADYTLSRTGEKGRGVADAFEYRSDTNPTFLTVDEIRSFVRELP